MSHSWQRLFRSLMTAAAVTAFNGCASMTEPVTTWMEEEPQYVTPSKVIPIWSDTVLHQAGHKAERGAGGRMMFYAGEGRQAVRVDGSLVVYAWDDSLGEHKRKPDRRYVFRTEDMQKHYSPSTVGDSYSFWIPWDEAGGKETELTLVSRFIGSNGAEVVSSPAKVILPGDVPMPQEVAQKSPQPVGDQSMIVDEPVIRQASFETTAVARSPKPHFTASDTIAIGEGFISRNMQGALSAEDLFDMPPRKQRVEAIDVTEELVDEATSDVPDSADTTSTESSDRLLRFQHRVQTTRATRQSVGRALSERYQSGGRRAPWDRD